MAAMTTRIRGPRSTGAARKLVLRSKTGFMALLRLRLHDQVALHLLVKRRAEVRAVVGEDARLVGLEGDHLRLARVADDVDVVVEEAPSVELVGRLLDVRDRHLHGV